MEEVNLKKYGASLLDMGLKLDVNLLEKHVNGLQEKLHRLESIIENRLEEHVLQLTVSFNNSLKIIEEKVVNSDQIVPDCESVIERNIILEDTTNREGIDKIDETERFERISPIKQSYMSDIFSNISLPGLRYIGEENQPKLHRLLWTFIHIVAIVISADYIQNAYYQWQNSPIVQSINSTLTRVEDIPLPAITYCRQQRYTEEYNKVWAEVFTRCLDNDTKWICNDEEFSMLKLSYDILSENPFFRVKRSNEIYFNLLISMNITRNNIIFGGKELSKFFSTIRKFPINDSMSWYNPDIQRCFINNCNSIIFFLNTNSRGLVSCQTIYGVQHGPHYIQENNSSQATFEHNSQQGCNWTPEKVLRSSCKGDSDVIYTTHPLVANIEKNTYFDQFLIIENPANYPDLNQNSIVLPENGKVEIMFTPMLVLAADDLVSVEASHRGCVFSNERILTMFKFYTSSNCHLECKINCFLIHCGCIPYYLPLFNDSVRVCCLMTDAQCDVDIKRLNSRFCKCDCPPECVSLSYKIETNPSVDSDSSDPSLLILFRNKKNEISSTYRHRLTSPYEFAAYCVGILGVFNGFSIMVVWEVLYWLTLRLWATVCQYLKTDLREYRH